MRLLQHARVPKNSLPENEIVIKNHENVIKKVMMNETSRFKDGSVRMGSLGSRETASF